MYRYREEKIQQVSRPFPLSGWDRASTDEIKDDETVRA